MSLEDGCVDCDIGCSGMDTFVDLVPRAETDKELDKQLKRIARYQRYDSIMDYIQANYPVFYAITIGLVR